MPRPRRQEAEAYKFPSSDRVNNPTSETALGLGPEDIQEQPIPEQEPEERLRHPRLQWNRGEQTDHSRTFGPLYIHDKVSAEQFIGSLVKDKTQGDMFATFNGLARGRQRQTLRVQRALDQPAHPGHRQRAMASLLYKDGMRGKVNLIYMDPPYNQSFRSNFQASGGLTRKPKKNGKTFRTIPMAYQGLPGYLPGRGPFLPRRALRTTNVWAENCWPKMGVS